MNTAFPRDWFWIVGGDDSRAWSSAAGSYVVDYPADRVTSIANEVELFDVLVRAGIISKAPGRTFSIAEVRAALLRVDAGATDSANDASALTAAAQQIGFILPPIG